MGEGRRGGAVIRSHGALSGLYGRVPRAAVQLGALGSRRRQVARPAVDHAEPKSRPHNQSINPGADLTVIVVVAGRLFVPSAFRTTRVTV